MSFEDGGDPTDYERCFRRCTFTSWSANALPTRQEGLDIVTLDERVNGDTHPDAKVILTSGDRFLARIKREFAAARDMLADDRYDEVTLELRALAGIVPNRRRSTA